MGKEQSWEMWWRIRQKEFMVPSTDISWIPYRQVPFRSDFVRISIKEPHISEAMFQGR